MSSLTGENDNNYHINSDRHYNLSFYQLPIEYKVFRLEENSELINLQEIIKKISENETDNPIEYILPNLNLITESINQRCILSTIINTYNIKTNRETAIQPTFHFTGDKTTITITLTKHTNKEPTTETTEDIKKYGMIGIPKDAYTLEVFEKKDAKTIPITDIQRNTYLENRTEGTHNHNKLKVPSIYDRL